MCLLYYAVYSIHWPYSLISGFAHYIKLRGTCKLTDMMKLKSTFSFSIFRIFLSGRLRNFNARSSTILMQWRFFINVVKKSKLRLLSRIYDFLSRNYGFLSRNYNFLSQNYDYLSRNYDFLSRNYDFLSRNYDNFYKFFYSLYLTILDFCKNEPDCPNKKKYYSKPYFIVFFLRKSKFHSSRYSTIVFSIVL